MAWIERCFFEEEQRDVSKLDGFGGWKWLLVGLIILILGIATLEFKQPYYFVQDDNFAQSFPIILEGCRSLFTQGVILDWSPYQFLGSPIASTGEYVLTYPPTYLSYAIARHLLRNELLTLDVFCILHLLAGYFITYLLLRHNKLHPSLAAAGSLSFILSGFTLIAGRSWFTMIAAVAWMPLLFLSVTFIINNKPTVKWIIGTGTTVGIFFHAGHAQMWVYSVIFFLFSIILLFCLGKLPLYKILSVITALLFGLAVIMPLFIPQWSIVRGVLRHASGPGITLKGILAIFLPYSLVNATHPGIEWGTIYAKAHMTPFYYSGTLFSGVFFASILLALVLLLSSKNKLILLKRFITDNPWIVLALLAFMLSLGKGGLLWTLQSKMPILNKFRMPFKFLHFFNLFAVMAGGTIIERCVCLSGHKQFWRLVLNITVCGLLLYNANLATSSFYSYADRPSDLKVQKEKHSVVSPSILISPRRVLSLSAERSTKTGYAFSLNHNFPTFFHIWALGGYDPFIDGSAYFGKVKRGFSSHPLEAARAYGIKWVIIEKEIEEDERIDAHNADLAGFFFKHGIRHQVTSDYILLRLNDSRTMAFVQSKPRQAMPVYTRNNGLDIDVSRIWPQGGQIVINVLWRPEVRLMSGKERLKSSTDRWGRVIAQVPVYTKMIALRYVPPWKAGFAAGAFFLLCALAAYLLWSRPALEAFPNLQQHNHD